MTRETKIGLLVALIFVIVIGILFSDYHRAGQEPTVAVLHDAGATARQAVTSPGSSTPAGQTVVIPEQILPGGVVQTKTDIEPGPGPVVVEQDSGNTGAAGLGANDADEAAKQGQAIVPVDPDKSVPQTGDALQSSYKAQPGDSVSRMAARLMGGNTAKNRKALIAANPSLQQDPNKVIVGQEYVIPGRKVSTADAALAGGKMEPAREGSPGTSAPTNGGLQWVYTVKSGDTLWAIATHQLGNASQMDAIAQLNQGVLHGQTTLQPGMKLKLPSPPVAVAN